MHWRDLVRRRRMVRAFTSEPVPETVLDGLLRDALRAPSAGNSQGRDLLALTSGADRTAFWSATSGTRPDDGWAARMASAPVLVVCLCDPGRYVARYAAADKAHSDPRQWPIAWWDADTAMAAYTLLLGAVDAGLGGSLFGVPGSAILPLRQAFSIPPDRHPVCVVALGHPDPSHISRPGRPGRRPDEEVLHHGRFGRPWTPEEQNGQGADDG